VYLPGAHATLKTKRATVQARNAWLKSQFPGLGDGQLQELASLAALDADVRESIACAPGPRARAREYVLTLHVRARGRVRRADSGGQVWTKGAFLAVVPLRHYSAETQRRFLADLAQQHASGDATNRAALSTLARRCALREDVAAAAEATAVRLSLNRPARLCTHARGACAHTVRARVARGAH
jgi:hypothetical protein